MRNFICGFMCAVIIFVIGLKMDSKPLNTVEHIKTGDIDWVCINNSHYNRSCSVVDTYK